MHDYGHTVMVGSCAIDPNWSNSQMLKLEDQIDTDGDINPVIFENGNLEYWNELYLKQKAEYANGNRDGNLNIEYNGIAHSCTIAEMWYGVHDFTVQEPKQSEKMVLVDRVGRGVYIGDRKISGHIDSDDYKDKVVQKTVEMKADPVQDNVNLTYQEQLILLYSKNAWDTFINLPNKSEDDIVEFKDAIHRLQQLIALRVARRVDTAIWLQP